mmetsp:Transcript_40744/g.97814  ORF Transcript_40744/g.97814 Transcript_40744/m.97814 type:complete len:211 (-) Transcript_40744:58-690(-)
MRRVGAFHDSAQLRVPNTSLLSGRAYASGANANLHHISTTQDQLFCHLPGDHVACHDHFIREISANLADALHESLRVAVGHIHTDHVGPCDIQHLLELLPVSLGNAGRHSDVLHDVLPAVRCKSLPLVHTVVLMHGCDHLELCQLASHLKCPNGIHVSSNDRHSCPLLLGMLEFEGSLQGHLRPRRQRGPLRPDQHILEIQLYFLVDTHG